MARIGGYETVRRLHQAGLVTTWAARPEDADPDEPPQFILKVFENIVTDVTQVGFAAEDEGFRHAVSTQDELCQAGAQHWAPIYKAGRIIGGSYYVSDIYRLTLDDLIRDPTIEIDGRAVHRIVSAIVAGLIELRDICGRAHGSLQAPNILIYSHGDIGRARVVLTDPLPPDQFGEATGEADDLRTVGQLLYQLVVRKPFRSTSPWPIPSSNAWNRLGRTANTWRELCSRLLDHEPKPGQLALDAIDEELGGIFRRRPLATLAVFLGAAAALALLALSATWLVRNFHPFGPTEAERELARQWLQVCTDHHYWFARFFRDLEDDPARRGRWERDADLRVVLERLDDTRVASEGAWAPEGGPEAAEAPPNILRPTEEGKADIARARRSFQLFDGVRAALLRRLRRFSEAWKGRGWHRPAWHLDDLAQRVAAGTQAAAARAVAAYGRKLDPQRRAQLLDIENRGHQAMNAILGLEGRQLPHIEALWRELEPCRPDVEAQTRSEPGQATEQDLMDLLAKLQRIRDLRHLRGPVIPPDKIAQWAKQLQAIAQTIGFLRLYADALADPPLLEAASTLARQHASLTKERDRLLAMARRPIAAGHKPDPGRLDQKLDGLSKLVAAELRKHRLDDPHKWWDSVRARAIPASSRLTTKWSARRGQLLKSVTLAKLKQDPGTFIRTAASVDRAWQSIREEAKLEAAELGRLEQRLTRLADAIQAESRGDSILAHVRTHADAETKRLAGRDAQERRDQLEAALKLLSDLQRSIRNEQVDRQAFLAGRAVRPHPGDRVDKATLEAWLAEIARYVKLPPAQDPRLDDKPWKATLAAIAGELAALKAAGDPRRQKQLPGFDARRRKLEDDIGKLKAAPWIVKNQATIVATARTLAQSARDLLEDTRKPPPLTELERRLLAEIRQLQTEALGHINSVEANADGDNILTAFAKQVRAQLGAADQPLPKRRDTLKGLRDRAAQLDRWASDETVDRKLFLAERTVRLGPNGRVTPAILADWLKQIPAYVKLPPADDPRRNAKAWKDRAAQCDPHLRVLAASPDPKQTQAAGKLRAARKSLLSEIEKLQQAPWVAMNKQAIAQTAARLAKDTQDLLEQAKNLASAEQRLARLRIDLEGAKGQLAKRLRAIELNPGGDKLLLAFGKLARAQLANPAGQTLERKLAELKSLDSVAAQVERVIGDKSIDHATLARERKGQPKPDGSISLATVRAWLAEVPDYAKLPPGDDPRRDPKTWKNRSAEIGRRIRALKASSDPKGQRQGARFGQALAKLDKDVDRMWQLAWIKKNQAAITQTASTLGKAAGDLLREVEKPTDTEQRIARLRNQIQRTSTELTRRADALEPKAKGDSILVGFLALARARLKADPGPNLQDHLDTLNDIDTLAQGVERSLSNATIDRQAFLKQRTVRPSPDGTVSLSIVRKWLAEAPDFVKLPPDADPRGKRETWRATSDAIIQQARKLGSSSDPRQKKRAGELTQAHKRLGTEIDQMWQLAWVKRNQDAITQATARLRQASGDLLTAARKPPPLTDQERQLLAEIERLKNELPQRLNAIEAKAGRDTILARFVRDARSALALPRGRDLQKRRDALRDLADLATKIEPWVTDTKVDRQLFLKQRKAAPGPDGGISPAILRAWLAEVPGYVKLPRAADPRRDPKAWSDRSTEIARRIRVLRASFGPEDKRRGAQLGKKLNALQAQIDAMWQSAWLKKNQQTLIATAARLNQSADDLLEEVGKARPTPDPRPAEQVWQGKLAAARSSLDTLAALSNWHKGLPVPDLKTALDTLARDIARMQRLTWPADRAQIERLLDANRRAADALPRDLGTAVERASGALAADISRLRALRAPTTSAVLNQEWLRRRDASAPDRGQPRRGDARVAPTAARVQGDAEAYAKHGQRVHALRAFLTGLDDKGQLPRGPAAAAIREEQREEALKNALAHITWEPDGTPRQSLDEIKRTPAWRDLCRAYRQTIVETEGLVADFRKIQTLLDWGYLLDDKPVAASHTVRQLHARWKGKALANKLPPTLRPVAARVGELLQLDGLGAADLPAWVKRADADTLPPLRAAAWLRLATVRAWPGSLADLRVDGQLQAAVRLVARQSRDPSRAAWLRQALAREAPRRWEVAFSAIAARAGADSLAAPDVTAVLELRDSFGVSADELAPMPRLRIRLHAFRLAVAGLPAAATRDAAAARVAQFQKDLEALPRDLLEQPRVRGFLDGLRKHVAGGAAGASGGPATSGSVAGWQATRSADGKAITYSWPAKSQSLTFVRIDSAGPAPVYLCTCEVSLGLFVDVVDASGKWSEFSPHFQDGNPALMQWKGPRVWRRTREGGPLRQSRNWLARAPAIRDAPYARSLRVGWPSRDHPMQYISPKAAQAFARLLGCRLPTSVEWRAVHKAAWGAGGQPNLRDATWRRQKDHRARQRNDRAETLRRQGLPVRVNVNWPDDGIFLPKHFRVARGADAEPATERSDGLLWFAKVRTARGFDTNLSHLVGNVAEYVFDPDSGFIKVVGASALSPGQLWDGKSRPYHVAWPVDLDGARFGYSDVGIRLAHSVGGDVFNIARLKDFLKAARYLP